MSASIQRNPGLVQISSAWGTHANGVLGRGQYVEITNKASRNGHGKMPPERKKCGYLTKAIVVEGGDCGRIVEVCTDPACDTHHGDARKSREAQERIRAQNRKQEEQRKQEMATRGRVLAAILEKVTVPLSKADLELVAREFINRLPQDYRGILSQRHSPNPMNGKERKGDAEIGNTLKNLDEAGYSRLLIELSLLDAAHNAYARDAAERLETVAKRYRINAQRIAESIAADFAARHKKRGEQTNRAPRRPKPAGPKTAARR